MVYAGWLQYADTEIISNARTAALSGTLGGPRVQCSCGELQAALGESDEEYGDITNAPWYDLNTPESKDFFGLLGTSITGATDSTSERQWTELLTDGGVGGTARAASRELEYEVTALAASESGLSYGVAWLAAALGGTCQPGCRGEDLCAFTACPTRPTLGGDACTGTTGAPDPDWDPIAAGDRLQRQLLDVHLLEGPTVSERHHVQSGWIVNLTFTLKAGNPFWWRLPNLAVDTGADDLPPHWTDEVEDFDILASARCPQPVDCLDDNPYCTGQDSPFGDEPFPGSDPNDPTSLLDPCYPIEPFTARRWIYNLGVEPLAPDWFDKAPILTFFSGSRPMHRLTVRWYTNPRNSRPDGQLDPCHACAELTVPWIPAHTTLTIDGRTRRAYVNCRGAGRMTSDVTLYGAKAAAYGWPTFGCTMPLQVEVIARSSTLARDSQYQLHMAPREEAC